MTSYWITFRIANRTVNGKTYDARYEALIASIKACASKWWVEPTSFIAFQSEHDIETITEVCKSAIAPQYDMFLIRKMDHQTAFICGVNTDMDIYVMMPYLKSF